MIRWSYLFPRLLLLAAICLAIAFGLDVAIQRGFSSAGSAFFGRQLKVGRVYSCPAHAQLVLYDVHLEDTPGARQLLADEVFLDLNTRALLKGRWVVDRAELHGLQFAHWPVPRPSFAPRPLSTEFEPMGDWLKHVDRVLHVPIYEQLETVQAAHEVADRWQQRQQQLKDQARQLRQKLAQLQARWQALEERPERSFREAHELYDEMHQIRRDLNQLRSTAEQLLVQVGTDADRLRAAQQRDLESLRDQLSLLEADGQVLAERLLGQQLTRQLQQLLAIVQWCEHHLPESVEPWIEPPRGAGVDIAFAAPQPRLTVRRLVLRGELEPGVQLTAEVHELTSDPALHARPIELQMQVSGRVNLIAQATLDYRGAEPRRIVRVKCPSIRQPRLALGHKDQLLSVQSGRLEVFAQVELIGDACGGYLIADHHQLQLRLGGDAADPSWRQALAAELASVEAARSLVHFSGTLAAPRWQLESTLGPELAAAFDRAWQQQLSRAHQRAKRLGELQLAESQQHVARLQLDFQEHLQPAEARVARLIGQLTPPLADPRGLRPGDLPGQLGLEALPPLQRR